MLTWLKRRIQHYKIRHYVNNLQKALREAEALNADHRCVVDKLHLLKFNDDISRIIWDRELLLCYTEV